MSLFLDGIYNSETTGRIPPSAIKIGFPVLNKGATRGYTSIQGLLTNEVTLSSQVKWGSILNDVSNLQAVASLLGSARMWSWIGASTMCWYGTEPIKTNFDFYLINYKRGLNLEKKLTALNMLTSLFQAGNASVYVHGGYAPQVLVTNNMVFNNGVPAKTEEQESGQSSFLDDLFGNVEGALGVWADVGQQDLSAGTITVLIGNKIKLSQMLVSRLDITPSIVEVPDGLPLYYKVSMSLTGAKPLLSTQVENMYGKKGK